MSFETISPKKNKILNYTGAFLSNTKNVKSAFVYEFYIDTNMSELLLKLAGNATVRGTINADGDHVGSVYNFINLACNKRGRFAYKVWERLTSDNSAYKDELEKLVTLEYVKGLSVHIGDLSHTKKTRRRQTPVMTLRALQRLVMFSSGKMASDFHRIVRRNVFPKALSKRSIPWSACVPQALCLRHIHHIQANALGIYQLTYAWQKKNKMERHVVFGFRFIWYVNILCGVLKSAHARAEN